MSIHNQSGAILMPAWCRSPEGQVARGEIESESKKRRWHKLSNTSSTVQKANGEAERREFIPYLVCQYPAAEKDAKSWLVFIKNTTGQVKGWKSVSTEYIQASNETAYHATSLARRKRTKCAGLSQHDQQAQGLELTLEEEKLLASTDKRQIKMLCVYTQVCSIVYACVKVLMTIFTRCTGRWHSVTLGANTM